MVGEPLGGHRRGHQHHRDVGGDALLGLVAQRVAQLVGLVDRDDHRRRRQLGDPRQRVGAKVDDDLEAIGPQLLFEQGPELGIGVDQQDTALAHLGSP
jgi:hypothetical protein